MKNNYKARNEALKRERQSYKRNPNSRNKEINTRTVSSVWDIFSVPMQF